jgi:hypothetical protein
VTVVVPHPVFVSVKANFKVAKPFAKVVPSLEAASFPLAA